MKAMKLYDQVERIHNELASLDIDDAAPLTVEQLTPFDHYHYFGSEAVDEAIVALGLSPGMRVLDIGSGIGGPARYMATRSAARVTALELQPDLDALAADLTERCGLAHLVEHRCGNILDGLGEAYDAVVSFLCFLHIADRKRLLAACRAVLAAGGGMYIEDFAKRREPTADETAALQIKVQCPVLPSPDRLRGAAPRRWLRRHPHRGRHVAMGRLHRLAVGGVPRFSGAQRPRTRARHRRWPRRLLRHRCPSVRDWCHRRAQDPGSLTARPEPLPASQFLLSSETQASAPTIPEGFIIELVGSSVRSVGL